MAKNDISIRPLIEADHAAWHPLWLGYLEFYQADLPIEVSDTTWQRLMDGAQDPHGLAAIGDNGQVLGIAHYLFHASTWTIGPYCYLQDLFVQPTARGKGVGAALIEAVYAAARKRGADQVYWLTQSDNHTARALYDRVGKATSFMKYRGF